MTGHVLDPVLVKAAHQNLIDDFIDKRAAKKSKRGCYTSRAYQRTDRECAAKGVPFEAAKMLAQYAYKVAAAIWDKNNSV